MRVLNAYIQRTVSIRKARKLLVSYIAPYDSVSSHTVSRWLTLVIHMAELPLEFTEHSTRSSNSRTSYKF